MKAVSLDELKEELSQADFIFNTIPAMILDRERLEQVKKEALIVDIASAP